MSKRYLEIASEITTWRMDLTLWNVFRIGEFTRENVSDWLADYTTKHHGLDAAFWPVDFHAVCGDIDIPWATKEGRDCYQRTHALTAQKTG